MLILLLLGSWCTTAQQEMQATQYMYHMNILNPAYAGVRESLSINFLARSQWLGITDAPKTATFSIHSPLQNNVGLGLSIVYDQLGPVKETNIFADFSYTIPFSYDAKIAFGIKGGMTSYFLNAGELSTMDPELNSLYDGEFRRIFPNFGMGIYYYTNDYYVGFSVPNLLKSKYFKTNSGYTSNASKSSHFYLTAGYVYKINNKIKLKPSFLVKGVIGAPVSFDLSINTFVNELFEFGLSYRYQDSVSAMVGVKVSADVRLGYAYDYILSNLGNYSNGSHEVMLLFDVQKSGVSSPRCF